MSLGVCPKVSLKDARDHRDEACKLLANGIDPSANRKSQKSVRAGRAANTGHRECFPPALAGVQENQRMRQSAVAHLPADVFSAQPVFIF